MAKKQTRRTVSLGIGHYTRLTEYAKANGASAAQVAEFAIDAQLRAPLDQDVFRIWQGERWQQAAEQGVATVARKPARAMDAYQERIRQGERQAALRALEISEREARVTARKEREARREAIRAETGRTRLCNVCDGPHTTRFCPTKPYAPAETGSRSERAARLCQEQHLTLREAAQRVGITHQAVSYAWHRLFPGKQPPRQDRSDPIAHAVVCEMVKAGKSIAKIMEETGFGHQRVYQIAREFGLKAKARPGIDQAFERAIAAVRDGASLGEAAADHGVSWGQLGNRCRQLGITPKRTEGKPQNGRGLAGAALVRQEGISVNEAARRMRCSPNAVRDALRRRTA